MWCRTPPPPETLEPGRLFRILLDPHPSLPIQFRFAGVALPQLDVRALPATTLAECDDAASHLGGDRRASQLWASVTALSVHAAGRRVFRDAADVMDLPDTEWPALLREVSVALSICGPTYSYSDWAAWHVALVQESEHSMNSGAASALGACFDIGGGIAKPRAIERPDRYWGRPFSELLDGHWLAYRAARAVYERDAK